VLVRLRRLYLLIIDALVINLAVITSLWLRFEGRIPEAFLVAYGKVAVPFTLASLAIFAALGLYSVILRYASIDELLGVAAGSGLSTTVLWVGLRWWVDPRFPRSVLVLAGLLEFVALGGLRLSVRLFIRFSGRFSRVHSHGTVTRVLIVGAGDAGAILGRELAKPADPTRKLVGYIDDDRAKKGSTLCGVKVFGGRVLIPKVVREENVQEIIIAMPSAPPDVIREIVLECQGLGVRIRALPRLLDMAGRPPELQMVKDIEIEDLLGRPEVKLDTEEIENYIRGKRVLVTGAGGSIGSEICRQVCTYKPELLILLGHGENSIFETRMRLDTAFPDVRKESVIADVRDSIRIQEVFAIYKPHVVFHAAAHKHVPLMEENLTEAIKTNIFGTLNVARAAMAYEAEKFVMISTDKAVNPTSVMGVTKRIAEMIVQYMNVLTEKTAFLSVRFGNVLGSRGSVVPIFKEQIARGGPVTITHPDMKRYFMTIKEAVQLVLQAGTMGIGGEIFVLDMGKPVRIVELAEQMIRLAGRTPYVDVDIVFSGMRPGEKLFEELLTAEEGTTATHHSQILVATQKPFCLSSFTENLKILESIVFPREYPCSVFNRPGLDVRLLSVPEAPGAEEAWALGTLRSAYSGARGDLEEDAEVRVGLGTRETAAFSLVGEEKGGSLDDPGSFEHPDRWSSKKDCLPLTSRRKAMLEILKKLVPNYAYDSAKDVEDTTVSSERESS